MMSRLATEAATASKRSELAERALVDLRDMHAEHRAALGEIVEQMGVQPMAVDSGTTNYVTQNITAIDERSIHNIAMQAVNAGAAQFGAAMAQNRMSQEAMMQSLLEYATTQQQQHNHLQCTTSPLPPTSPRTCRW
jgi:hypothetical protein